MKIDKEFLDKLYNQYATPSFIHDDPIQFVYQYSNPKDQEIVAFIVSTLAFGHRPQIIKFIPKVLSHLGKSPYQSLIHFKIKKIRELHKLVYRFIKGSDLHILFYRLHIIFQDNISLEELFFKGYKNKQSIFDAICHVVDTINSAELPKRLENLYHGRERNFKFLLPHPKDHSACKRMNLFLKWMVRCDKVDLGLWKKIQKKSLIIPLDTHVARMSQHYKLTNRKSIDWKTAIEITEKLKKWDSEDPVKYDFSLFGLGLNFNETQESA